MLKPALTVALLTPDNFATVRKTAECVAAQSNASETELLILAADPTAVRIDESIEGRFHSTRILPADLTEGTGGARALAVREAAAPVIAFGEDHCFPEPGWGEALVRAHGDSWAAVGPVVRNANPESIVSWADLLMGYGPWLAPGRSIERDHLPGHNSSYKREALLELDAELPILIEAETALQWRLRAAGHRLFQESNARVAHTNFDSWSTWIPVSYHAGRVFAATRAGDWSAARRIAFAIATPLVPLVRLWRHLRQGFSAGLPAGLIARIAPVLAIGLVVDGAGQFMGCLRGAGHSRATLVEWDFHRNAPRGAARAVNA